MLLISIHFSSIMKILEKKEKTKVKKLVILAVWAVVITAEIG